MFTFYGPYRERKKYSYIVGKKQRTRIANISSEAKALGQEFATLLKLYKIINIALEVCKAAYLFALESAFF